MLYKRTLLANQNFFSIILQHLKISDWPTDVTHMHMCMTIALHQMQLHHSCDLIGYLSARVIL